MDPQTLSAYAAGAVGYCGDWLGQPAPEDLQRLWRRYFKLGGTSVDVGSGSGRDVDWLNRNGYPCSGLDACASLIAEARRRFPRWRFDTAALPALEGVPAAHFDNVICETVIMHLPAQQVRPAVRALQRILAPGGTLYLSWRVTDGDDVRDAAGRLYSAFPVFEVREEWLGSLGSPGSVVLYDEEETSLSSGRRVHRMVVRRLPQRTGSIEI